MEILLISICIQAYVHMYVLTYIKISYSYMYFYNAKNCVDKVNYTVILFIAGTQ